MCFGMFDDVGEGFLKEAVEGDGNDTGQGGEIVTFIEDLNARAAGEVAAVGMEDNVKADVIEGGRTEVVGELADFVHGGIEEVDGIAQALANGFEVGREFGHDDLKAEVEAGEGLTGFVVKFVGDAFPFLFLRENNLLAEVFHLLTAEGYFIKEGGVTHGDGDLRAEGFEPFLVRVGIGARAERFDDEEAGDALIFLKRDGENGCPAEPIFEQFGGGIVGIGDDKAVTGGDDFAEDADARCVGMDGIGAPDVFRRAEPSKGGGCAGGGVDLDEAGTVELDEVIEEVEDDVGEFAGTVEVLEGLAGTVEGGEFFEMGVIFFVEQGVADGVDTQIDEQLKRLYADFGEEVLGGAIEAENGQHPALLDEREDGTGGEAAIAGGLIGRAQLVDDDGGLIADGFADGGLTPWGVVPCVFFGVNVGSAITKGSDGIDAIVAFIDAPDPCHFDVKFFDGELADFGDGGFAGGADEQLAGGFDGGIEVTDGFFEILLAEFTGGDVGDGDERATLNGMDIGGSGRD